MSSEDRVIKPEAVAIDKQAGVEIARFSDGLYFRPLFPKTVALGFWTPVPSSMSRYAEEALAKR